MRWSGQRTARLSHQSRHRISSQVERVTTCCRGQMQWPRLDSDPRSFAVSHPALSLPLSCLLFTALFNEGKKAPTKQANPHRLTWTWDDFFEHTLLKLEGVATLTNSYTPAPAWRADNCITRQRSRTLNMTTSGHIWRQWRKCQCRSTKTILLPSSWLCPYNLWSMFSCLFIYIDQRLILTGQSTFSKKLYEQCIYFTSTPLFIIYKCCMNISFIIYWNFTSSFF